MITYNSLVKEIEQLATKAGQTHDEQHIREQLTAIRALCDVVLNEQKSTPKNSVPSTNFVTSPVTTPTFAQPLPQKAQVLKEDDANGDSLFDF